MSSSFVEFQGWGFWARDGLLELWADALAEAVPEDPPAWLAEAREDWRVEARMGKLGTIHLGLDENLTSADRVATALAVAKAAYERMAGVAAGTGRLPVGWLNDLGIGGQGSYWTADLDLNLIQQLADAFVALLRGELHTTSLTSPVLPLPAPTKPA